MQAHGVAHIPSRHHLVAVVVLAALVVVPIVAGAEAVVSLTTCKAIEEVEEAPAMTLADVDVAVDVAAVLKCTCR